MKALLCNEEMDATPLDPIACVKQALSKYGVSGFWFQGVANSAYEDYHNCALNRLLTRKMLLSSDGVITSSLTVQKLHEQYLTRVAATDPNFVKALRLDAPYHYILDDSEQSKTRTLFGRYGIHSVISWPLKHFASNMWSCRFTLLSKQFTEDLDLVGIETVLKQAKMTLLENYHSEVTPYRQHKLFNKTAIRALQMAALGLQNEEISQELDMTIRGVEYHFESMRHKLSATNRTHLVYKAHQLEII
ncbi:helix-turn-helix transcriptional regulator [Shewanella sairae]|uniref:Helix-turn-helix transcriptional regulator n=1 Tax=Shewanella sairae TaxID=190310 RepID=A0ABQ4PRV0_9GAMM|nr:helix-turn-helix transcriptional regulator [Shewanella sairae]MCL1132549.1 helix-turn-helix transcriptional regulator [Shewanella sairae]GIU52277.1 helix-turn-helix transcriptional regulator [Shewanella sairae]